MYSYQNYVFSDEKGRLLILKTVFDRLELLEKEVRELREQKQTYIAPIEQYFKMLLSRSSYLPNSPAYRSSSPYTSLDTLYSPPCEIVTEIPIKIHSSITITPTALPLLLMSVHFPLIRSHQQMFTMLSLLWYTGYRGVPRISSGAFLCLNFLLSSNHQLCLVKFRLALFLFV